MFKASSRNRRYRIIGVSEKVGKFHVDMFRKLPKFSKISKSTKFDLATLI
jgi:hypothetical protein